MILTAADLGSRPRRAAADCPLGAMVASGRGVLLEQCWAATIPGFAVFVAGLGFNPPGGRMRDVFDPKPS